MKTLVTGGAGFIGSALVRAAVRKGHDVLNVDCLTYAACLNNLELVEADESYHFAKVDIRDRAATGRAISDFQPDTIFHLAAESHVDRSIDGPKAFIETNVVGTFNMLDAALAYWNSAGKPAGFRFIHVSTDEVYGTLADNGSFTETTPYAPSSPYSASKASSDHLVHAWHHTFGLPAITTNCSNNYGPYQFPEKLIPVVIINALAGKSIPVYGSGNNVRDWLHVDDHVHALMIVAERGKPGEKYNVGGRNEVRNIDLVRMICRILDDMNPQGAPCEKLINFVNDRPGHDFRYAIDPTRIETELGWRHLVALEGGMRDTVQWYLDNRPWWEHLVSLAAERRGEAA